MEGGIFAPMTEVLYIYIQSYTCLCIYIHIPIYLCGYLCYGEMSDEVDNGSSYDTHAGLLIPEASPCVVAWLEISSFNAVSFARHVPTVPLLLIDPSHPMQSSSRSQWRGCDLKCHAGLHSDKLQLNLSSLDLVGHVGASKDQGP